MPGYLDLTGIVMMVTEDRGDECIELNVPKNAWVSGGNWYCNDGYRKQNNKCVKFTIPANAFAQGDQWYCSIGFKKVNNSCKEMTSAEKLLQLKNLALQRARARSRAKYCELDGATTDSGKDVTGECYMYSDKYGELEGAETEDGISVSGECYRYSERYAELEGAETENGESVSGECYFYNP
jgi:hypothetical protein